MMSLSEGRTRIGSAVFETTDASLSAEDAMSDEADYDELPESLDPAYRGLLAKAACILLSSNRFSPGAAIAEARKVMTLAGLIHSYPCLSSVSGRGSLEASISPDPTAIRGKG